MQLEVLVWPETLPSAEIWMVKPILPCVPQYVVTAPAVELNAEKEPLSLELV